VAQCSLPITRRDTLTHKDTPMKRSPRTLLAATLAALTLATACSSLETTPAAASASAYRVDATQSAMQFVTLKAGQAGAGGIAEVQRFTHFDGGVDAAGKVTLDIELASAETGISIRDERLRTLLFNVAVNPRARFAAQIDPAWLAALPVAGTQDVDVAGSLTLAGQTRPVAAQLRATRLASGRLQVSTRSPVVIDLAAFGLKPGVEALREVMGLNFLAASAPVSFALVLNEAR
jgi:polyisoprenoid-binding protein YceI